MSNFVKLFGLSMAVLQRAVCKKETVTKVNREYLEYVNRQNR